MKLAHFDGFEVTGFENSGGWRLHVRDQPPNPMNELIASPLVPVTPAEDEEQAMLAAIVEWKSAEATPKKA